MAGPSGEAATDGQPAGTSRADRACAALAPAGNEDAAALAQAGMRLFQGQGTDRDPAGAAACFERAARAGDPGAKAALGAMALAGDGLPRDPTLAAKWFLAGTRAGSAHAALGLAGLFASGQGLPRDPGWACYYAGLALSFGGLSSPDAALARELSRPCAAKTPPPDAPASGDGAGESR